jgi:hypothetical protein
MLKSMSLSSASAGVGTGVGAGVAAGVAGAVEPVGPAEEAELGVAGAQAARRSDTTTSDDEIRARTGATSSASIRGRSGSALRARSAS